MKQKKVKKAVVKKSSAPAAPVAKKTPPVAKAVEQIADVGAMMEQDDKRTADKQAADKIKREEKAIQRKELSSKVNAGLRVVHNKHGNGSKVVNSAGDTRAVTANIPDSLKGLTSNLKEAKIATRDESTKQRRPLYINVLQDGSFDMSSRYDKDSSLHCFLNGAEVAMIVTKKSTVKENNNNQNLEIMSTTTKGKTEVKKVAAKKTANATGKVIEKTVAQVLALIKAGKEVWTASGRAKYTATYLGERDKASVLSVIVK